MKLDNTKYLHVDTCYSHSESVSNEKFNYTELRVLFQRVIDQLQAAFPESVLVHDVTYTFNTIKSSYFHIYIIGGPASGKTELMNAIVGHSCIQHIIGQRCLTSYISKDIDYFYVKELDLDGVEIQHHRFNSQEELQSFTPIESCTKVDIFGRLPLAEKAHINLAITEIAPSVLYKEITRSILSENRGLAIYCQGATHIGSFSDLLVNCFKNFNFEPFDFKAATHSNSVGSSIPTVFALTKMDCLSPQNGDKATLVFESFNEDLAYAGIKEGGIFPISVHALKKDDEDDYYCRESFARKCKKYPEMHLERYSSLGGLTPIIIEEYNNTYTSIWDDVDIHTEFPTLHKFIYTY